ncbi:MAG TPA: undecaprenyldiphospho-muramoylpentapeptide beta-N-acetylglucosaminyltransferase [Chromatiaceae bacterium]|jgi:UDP-N-acetylglucosamine--N-acetylmuramyl-(pentapeptide) pyrophosphoryl-undecaprenol N-acetylglucosamine transferase|nr:undecaprenyldiphospho-muramoylpentapeptide beta-N-acetylglucosaminyltransferase [Chromatiaceae bacterium]HIA09456.1 undecaprenyldiphospho-muramoylpentapeptide beta-N-acetylglucosaminyltransferase [Chromatiaceae bacterium]HIN82151.1 undecaprenyldiphospho-muramoylpentapeptide beta-N-acetylglucosaminyltransferase [Chromatiales bacterium]HIO14801.1 undecaprenyldiphospho-muramoylpentapeptide beta-N-acetylglucosaminyltransferase [Chromatiales bacterium]HIO54971.1 undecaprenyldiphospho-muramoylpent
MGTRVMIMAGGTGGHIFPALAVADDLRERGHDIVWMGTPTGMEADLVPKAGYPIEWISVRGVRGGGLLRRLASPFRLLRAMWQAAAVMRRQRPAVLLGMGGFASGPGGLVGRLMGVPLVIHEQNAVAGMTNRLLARVATRVLQAFPDSLGNNAAVTGNPVRKSIRALAQPADRFAQRSDRFRLLVLGGSQGAASLNQTLPKMVRALGGDQVLQVRHQCGQRHHDVTVQAYASLNIEAQVEAFITDMDAAYAWADLVICRAGALTIAELAVAGVGAVLIPYPHAVDDHQTHNAAFLADAGAAVVVQEHELGVERLLQIMSPLLQRDGRTMQMAEAARGLAQPDAARQVADVCLELADSEACP